MANVALHIKEQTSYYKRKAIDSNAYAEILGEPKQNAEGIPLGSSPPSFTSTLFSCCSNDWGPRNKRRETQSPLFSPNSMPPQNMIIDPTPLQWTNN